jgi:hypothetical protein
VADRDVAGGEVVVGVAHAGRGHLDLDLAGRGSSETRSTTSHSPGADRMIAPRGFIRHRVLVVALLAEGLDDLRRGAQSPGPGGRLPDDQRGRDVVS